MRKVYFISRPQSEDSRSGRWRHTLKQTYKSTDAIRDILAWSGEGREFYVSIRDVAIPSRKLIFHINPPGSPGMITDFATKRPVVGVIDQILQWTQDQVEFDITMLERRRRDPDIGDSEQVMIGRLLGKSAN